MPPMGSEGREHEPEGDTTRMLADLSRHSPDALASGNETHPRDGHRAGIGTRVSR